MKLSFSLFAAMLLASIPVATSLGPTDKADCTAYPDPHFKTWHGILYDFHAGCDLVMIKNPTFVPGGLYLLIRTRDMGGWAGITNVALRIGNDILEVTDDGRYYINGILNATPLPTIGTYGLSINTSASGSTTTYKVSLRQRQYVRVKQNTHLRVDVSGIGYDFLGSVGLCGTWTTPGMISRDGGTEFIEGNDFGEEWQVRKNEPLLFQPASDSDPQYPDACLPAPDVSDKFTNMRSVANAENVCVHVQDHEFANCVFDVIVTGKGVWARRYQKTKIRDQCLDNDYQDNCMKLRGTCVTTCNTRDHACFPDLCCQENTDCRCWCAIRRITGPVPRKPGPGP